MSLSTPILLILFNRPEPTKRVFEEIRRAQPQRLFIAADGPRPDRPEDTDKCGQAREAVSNIDWPCEVKTLFRERNLGCRMGATSAITWFFEHVESGIVLEDDCLPDSSFFVFCSEMLEHFRYAEEIAMISGYNVCGKYNIPYSYTFSKYGHLWGWASWRRSWNQYDVTMKIWEDPKNRRKIKRAMNDRRQWNYHEWLYEETYHGRKDTWDYQWESYRLLYGQLSVTPSTNMIENLGFGPDATHTKQNSSTLILPRGKMEFPLIHNPHIGVDDTYDRMQRPAIPATSMRMRKFKGFIRKLLPISLYQKIK